MKRIAIVYGVIIGLVIIGSAILAISNGVGIGQAWLGFLVMIVAFSAIFFAMRQYRDQALGGVIRFKTAALLGLAIAAVASVVYVAVWEVYLAATDYTFINFYTDAVIAGKKAEGLGASELTALTQEMEQMKVSYANPLIRLPMTLLEVFPIGVLVSLVSAWMLRDKRAATA